MTEEVKGGGNRHYLSLALTRIVIGEYRAGKIRGSTRGKKRKLHVSLYENADLEIPAFIVGDLEFKRIVIISMVSNSSRPSSSALEPWSWLRLYPLNGAS